MGGTVFLKKNLLGFYSEKKIKTSYGTTIVRIGDGFAFVQRHGKENLPPHKTNHYANILAFKKLGIKEILAINSVGSLKRRIKPGSLVVPHDYIQFFPKTYFNDHMYCITPALCEEMRAKILRACDFLGYPVICKAIYFQTIGPRLETVSEVKFIRRFADIVGMTLADEATLAQEQGLCYASICTVDNYAHGISKSLTYEEIVSNASKNVETIANIIYALVRTK
ncbi:MAG: MTAP family purine nucleoside phosphorylase [Candidatus Diapherotrites archaeon]|nr:MTAP family purine nucleoside phosphorylase [Candidatus Diapherotrites archaeon]